MLEQLKQKYLISIREKARTIEALFWQHLEGDKDALDAIRLHAHSLKGSGATFGFPEISEAGRELEAADEKLLKAKLADLIRVIKEASAGTSASAANEEGPHPETISGTRQVLIIERNPQNAAVISKCISRLDDIEGCVIAGTGAEARKQYTAARFSLVVLDLVLPDKDGREILREIKNSEQFCCPVLVISGVPNDKIYLECMSIGADEYLPKPFDTDKLYFEARQILVRSQIESPVSPETTVIPAPSTEPPKPEVSDEKMSVQLKNEHFLVAEDDEMQGIFIKQILNDEGAEVTLVENGVEAMKALEDGHFSAVILDGRMPEMDGFETLQAIRKKSGMKNLPVIMVTAMGSEEDIIRGYSLGANDYILKPFSETQLVDRIRGLLTKAA